MNSLSAAVSPSEVLLKSIPAVMNAIANKVTAEITIDTFIFRLAR
jgi:hypothetical protein